MSARVSVRIARLPDRRGETALAVKSASTPEEINHLAAEAERLQRIAHPGVVSYVDYSESGARAELHTVYAGEPLDRWRGTLEQAAGLVAAVASILADLHGAGEVHGRIDRSHVLRGPQGRPVLCGLSPPPESADPATDVAAVGRLLGELLSEAEAAARRESRVPWRSWLRKNKPQRALERVAAHAADPLAARRPSARALAGAILEAAPDAQLPDEDAAPRPAQSDDGSTDLFQRAFVDQRDTGEEEIFIDRPWQGIGSTGRPGGGAFSRPRALVVGLLLAGMAVLLVGRLLAGVAPADRLPSENPPGGSSPLGDIVPDCPGTTGTTDAAGPSGQPPIDPIEATTWADTDGDGCVEAVTITADGVVQVAGERWAVGRPGDEITLGDWDCDGSVTPAVYRQSTGDVFVFEGWADRGRPLEVEPMGQVPGGVGFGTSRPACDVPVVELDSGARRTVEVNP